MKTMLSALTLACLPSLRSVQAQAPDTWDALAHEWEQAYVHSFQVLNEGQASGDDRHPTAELARRFEALAERGEGRAVLWLLRHRSEMGAGVAAGRSRDFERVRRAGEAEWVARALLELAKNSAGLAPAEVAKYC